MSYFSASGTCDIDLPIKSTTKIKPKPIINIVAQAHLIEDKPTIIITKPYPQTTPSPTPFTASPYTIFLPPVDPNPTLILDNTLLHPLITYLASTPIVIPTQNKIHSKYVLEIDTISQNVIWNHSSHCTHTLHLHRI